MWTLVNNPRVPEKIRERGQPLGPGKDEFVDTGGWPHQLYVREARRMVSDYVMTQHNCQGRAVADDPVGLAAYTMDSHNVQRYVDSQGHVRNEGDVQVGGFSPYPISYRSIVPKESECENLLVPVCLAATHIAYGSIRMEPVFMVLGQSSATAAALAIDAGTSVQKVDYAKLRERLLADKQVLAWTGPQRSAGIDPKSLPGLVHRRRRGRKARRLEHQHLGRRLRRRAVPARRQRAKGRADRHLSLCGQRAGPVRRAHRLHAESQPRHERAGHDPPRRRRSTVTLNQRTARRSTNRFTRSANSSSTTKPSSSSPTPTPTATSSSTPCSSCHVRHADPETASPRMIPKPSRGDVRLPGHRQSYDHGMSNSTCSPS